jgi:hypothetical protein
MTFKDLKKKVRLEVTQQQSRLFERLQNKPFWIWNIEGHKQEDVNTNGNCCFNHIIGLPQKDGNDKPHLITLAKPDKANETFEMFDKAAVKEGKDPALMEKIAKPKISYSEDYDKALKSTEFWRASLLEDVFNLNISDPRQLEQKAKEEVSDEKLRQSTLIITSIEDCIKPLEEYFDAGYTKLYPHSTSPDEIKFIQDFSKKVLPYFNGKNSK